MICDRRTLPARDVQRRVGWLRHLKVHSASLAPVQRVEARRPATQRRVAAFRLPTPRLPESSVLGGSGEENLGGEELHSGLSCASTSHSPSSRPSTDNRHSHRMPFPLSRFEFILASVFVAAVTTDPPRTLVQQRMTVLPVPFRR